MLRKHYTIDWLWADSEECGQFSTQADLTDAECLQVTKFLERRKEAGDILFPSIFESITVQQNFDALRLELIEAVGCEDDTCRTCLAEYDHAGDGYDGECPACADKTEAKRTKI